MTGDKLEIEVETLGDAAEVAKMLLTTANNITNFKGRFKMTLKIEELK